jgi:N-methylhydantoinase B/oxoprolinase/acetone carboxylase alpha subunit
MGLGLKGQSGVNYRRRQPEKVREDVVKEFIKIKAARDVYKVVLDHNTLEIDQKATQALRKNKESLLRPH